MADTSIGIKIAVDSGQVKTNLDKVQAEFESASSKINKALQSIKGFVDLKKQTEETAKAYAEAQKRVAELAKAAKSGSGSAELARELDSTARSADQLKSAFEGQSVELQKLKEKVGGVTAEYRSAKESLRGLKSNQDSDAAAILQAQNNYEALRLTLAAARKEYQDQKSAVSAAAAAYREASGKVALLSKEVAAANKADASLAKDFAQAKTEAARLKESLSGQQQQLRQTRAAMTAAGVSTTGLAGQQAALRTQLDATQKKYQELAKVAAARDTLNLTPHIDIAAEINKARAAYATLAASGKLSMAELAQAKVSMRERIDELTQRTNGWRDALGQIKGRLFEVAAAFGGIVLSSRQAIAFESAMADVGKTVDGTKEQLAQLGNELRDMSFEIPLPVEELAGIAAAGGQLGVAAKDIGAFTKVTAKMATAFNMTAEAAGQAIGTMANVWQVGIGEIELFGDAINQLGNNTAATESRIVDVLLRIGGTARQFGLAKEQAAALAATMLSLGQSPEVASTSINALLVRMQTATQQSDKFQEALGRIGMSAEEMAVMVEANPQKALEALLNTLSELKGRERAEVLTGLFGAEYQDNVSVLVGSLGEYQKALGLVSDKTKYAGAMNKEFEVRVATTKAQLQLLWNTVTDIVKSVGSGFLPAIKGAAKFLREMLTPIAELARLIPGLSAVVVSLGTGMMVFGTAIKLLGILKLALVSFGGAAAAAFGQAGVAATSFSTVLAAALGKLTAAFTVGWAIGTWINQFDIVKKAGVTTAHVLTMGWLKAREAWLNMTGGDTAAIRREMEIARQTYTKMMDEINGKAKESSGVRIAEEKKVSTETAKSAAKQKQVTGEALKEMGKQYQEYADKVKRLQGELADSQRSVEEELRDMRRSGMSDLQAWQDRKLEAGEFAKKAREAADAARQLVAGGNMSAAEETYKVAVEYADKAKRSYAGLNEEVKQGDKVVVSGAAALQAAMEGVRSAGDLKAKLITEQIQAFSLAQAKLNAQSGGQLDAALDQTKTKADQLATSADTAKQKVQELFQIEPPADGDWGKVWTAMESGSTKAAGAVTSDWDRVWDSWLASGSDDVAALERKLEELIKDRTMMVRIKTIEERSTGGQIRGYHLGGIIQALATGGGVRDILGGGRLPGFGGGDVVPLLGEAGEFMINKWASLKAGLPALQYLNAGQLELAIAELSKRLKDRIGYRLGGMVRAISPARQTLATGGAVTATPGGGDESMTINFNFGGGVSIPVTTTRANARAIKREFQRMEWRSSR